MTESEPEPARQRRIMDIIERVGYSLKVPEPVIESSAADLKEIMDRGLLDHKVPEESAAAVLYYVCKKNQVPLYFSDITEVADVRKRITKNIYNKIYWELGGKSVPFDDIALLYKLVDELNLSPRTARLAEQALRMARKLNLTDGIQPRCYVAAALYIASRFYEDIRQKKVAYYAKITGTTLRERYKSLLPLFDDFALFEELSKRFRITNQYEAIVSDFFNLNPDMLMLLSDESSSGRIGVISERIVNYTITRIGASWAKESREKLGAALNSFHSYLIKNKTDKSFS
jgi:transcription initiation factor TFIIIB Brf1 subunit/transcription initiation factor TFIIB